jgi:hypothetical protein
MEIRETLKLVSSPDQPLGVIAGHGSRGYGAIMVHQPSTENLPFVSTELWGNIPTKGVGFMYYWVDQIEINGKEKWNNSEQQNVAETGDVSIEVYDTLQMQRHLASRERMLNLLGIHIVD